MRYTATTTTLTPDGRIIPAGQEYDYPPTPESEPTTIGEIMTRDQERREDAMAHLHGEPPRKSRPSGKKNETKGAAPSDFDL